MGSGVCENNKACSSFVDIGMHLRTTSVFLLLGALLIALTRPNEYVSTFCSITDT